MGEIRKLRRSVARAQHGLFGQRVLVSRKKAREAVRLAKARQESGKRQEVVQQRHLPTLVKPGVMQRVKRFFNRMRKGE